MRLLVIDDALDIVTLLKLAFQLDGYAVDTALTAEEALELVAVNEYDVAILDLGLPDLDGMALCTKLRRAYPQLLIIMLTGRSSKADIIAGLDAGADDYLTKPFDYEELVARVRALLRRDMRVRQPRLECGALQLDPTSGKVWLRGQELKLARKQFRILEYLMRHAGEVVSQEALLEHVWNAEANPFTNVVRVHINALRRALCEVSAVVDIIETIIGMGYRLNVTSLQADLTQTLSPQEYPSSEQIVQSDTRRKIMPTQSWQDQLNAPRLLIVDDSPDINQLLTVYFHEAGFNTVSAYDGRSALGLFQRSQPALIILDLGLPDMDGLELCREIRCSSAVPIVMLTRRNTPEQRQQGLDAGANEYLTKPFDIAELHAAVQGLLA